MIPHPKHDYLLFMTVLIIVIAAVGAVALHYSGTTAAASGKAVYYSCQQLHNDYQKYNCNWRPEQPICAGLRVEMESRSCI
ncbi:hypothetical protein KY338_03485 [Candidatus Woesearchaeota archaeon]|nr:hypothetical protein [Candidatus Woesearchaeota archaeon]MBW3005334.1 hypothetical protein [Candidatus Woesearchaeota archaeon]